MQSIIQSFKVSATLEAYRFVGLTGTANTVGYPEASTRLPIGVTIDTVKETTQAIPVAMPGSIAKLYFNDSVVSGGLVASDSSGRGVPFTLAATTTSLTLSAAYGGILIDAKVDLTGTLAHILVMPGYEAGA